MSGLNSIKKKRRKFKSFDDFDVGSKNRVRKKPVDLKKRFFTTDDISSSGGDDISLSSKAKPKISFDYDSNSPETGLKNRGRSDSDTGLLERKKRNKDEIADSPKKNKARLKRIVSQGQLGKSKQQAKSQEKFTRLTKVKEWLKWFKLGAIKRHERKKPKYNRKASETKQAIQKFKLDAYNSRAEYNFGLVDDFLDTFKPKQKPEIYIMEGAFPDQNKQVPGFNEEFAQQLPVTVDRSLHRSGQDNQNHGATVSALTHYTFPEANINLAVSLGDPRDDFQNLDFNQMSADDVQKKSAESKNLSFQSYFDKLLKQNVENSVINLSQMVLPNEELSASTISKMKAVAAKNNVIVLAMGNQSAKSDDTPAFQRLNAAIKDISEDANSKGTIVVVENAKRLDKNKNTAELVSTSNYISDPAKKLTTLALMGGSPEITDKRWGQGTGTSYAAPKLSALISKLTTSINEITGKTVNGKDVVEALVSTGKKYDVKKKSQYDPNTHKLLNDNSNLAEDNFKITVPDGEEALKKLMEVYNV